jgi:hypothetical protein
VDDDVLAVVLSVGLAGVAFATLRRVWNNELGHNPDVPPRWWGFGLALWRGFVRLNPVAGPMFAGAAVALAAAKWAPEWLAAPVVLLLGVPFLVVPFSVVLLGRPKCVIAPHLRHQPGAIREWLGAKVAPTPPPQRVALGPADRPSA